MKDLLLMLAVAALGLTLIAISVLAPRCAPGGRGIMIGSAFLLAGCRADRDLESHVHP